MQVNTLTDDDVAELGYYDLQFSLKALDVYCATFVPTRCVFVQVTIIEIGIFKVSFTFYGLHRWVVLLLLSPSVV